MRELLLFLVLSLAGRAVFATELSADLPVEKRFEIPLWNLRNVGQPFRIDSGTLGWPGLAGADVRILDAWKTQADASTVLVAVLDAEFDFDHPDLKAAFVTEKAFDFITNRPGVPKFGTETPHHGTLVAGVIGANGWNSVGITGLARQVRLLPVRVIPEKGDEMDAHVALAIRYAVEQGARVINCSFGKWSTSDEVRAALELARERDVLVVAGAGNHGGLNDREPFWPSAYSRTLDNVVSVAATDRLDRLWPSSGYGLTVDLAAPGHEIFSTGNPAENISRYQSFSGTSAATPHVSAVAALMIARHPTIRARELKEILIASADALPALAGKVKTGGRLNAARALQQAERLRRATAAACDFESSKNIFARAQHGYSAVWTLAEERALSAPYTGDEPAYRNYAAWARERAPWSARENLRKYVGLIEKVLERMELRGDFKTTHRTDIQGVQKIIQGEIGGIHPLTCLESLPFRELLKVVDLTKHQHEYMAHILRRGAELKVIGDFYSGNTMGVAESSASRELRERLVREGWKIEAMYHNHPFATEVNPVGDVGGNLAPSSPDLRYFKRNKFPAAWITNGIETLVLREREYAELE